MVMADGERAAVAAQHVSRRAGKHEPEEDVRPELGWHTIDSDLVETPNEECGGGDRRDGEALGRGNDCRQQQREDDGGRRPRGWHEGRVVGHVLSRFFFDYHR